MVRLRPVSMTNDPPSVLWHCWLGRQTCRNRRPYNLYYVGPDVKPCSINQSICPRRHAAPSGNCRQMSQKRSIFIDEWIWRHDVYSWPVIILVLVWRKSIDFWQIYLLKTKYFRPQWVTLILTFRPRICSLVTLVCVMFPSTTTFMLRENRRHKTGGRTGSNE